MSGTGRARRSRRGGPRRAGRVDRRPRTRRPGARSTQVLVPSRVIGPGLGARSSVTQPGSARPATTRTQPPMRRSYVAGHAGDRRAPDVRLGHRRVTTRRPSRAQATSAMTSTSTGAPSGSSATPTALRACRPCSPSTSPNSFEAPLITAGWPVKPGGRRHEAGHLDDLDEPAQADQRVDRGERVQRAVAGPARCPARR